MNRRDVKRPQAYRDVVELADYIALGSLASAVRFAEAFDSTCEALQSAPGLGSPCETANEKYADLRYLPIEGFPNHLIFFLATARVVEILRVCHAARDLENIFDVGSE